MIEQTNAYLASNHLLSRLLRSKSIRSKMILSLNFLNRSRQFNALLINFQMNIKKSLSIIFVKDHPIKLKSTCLKPNKKTNHLAQNPLTQAAH